MKLSTLRKSITIVPMLVISMLLPPIAHGGSSGTGNMETINVSVWYRERIMVPTGAVIHVSLLDVSRMDAPSETIASTEVEAEGGPPWEISVQYDPQKIDPRFTYSLRSWIDHEGQLLFTSTEAIDPFNSGDPVKIMLSRSAGEGGSSSSAGAAATLEGVRWVLTELNGQPSKPGTGDQEVFMEFDAAAGNVGGFSGCNNFNGGYESADGKLKFGNLMMTMKACVDGMEQEAAMHKALGETQRYTIAGDKLALYSGDERLVARFSGN